MSRGNTDLTNYEYDNHLTERAKTSRTAKQELQQRHIDRKHAHNSDGIGYHFGLGDSPIKIDSKEHFRKELDRRGLMLEVDVKKNLKLKKGMA